MSNTYACFYSYKKSGFTHQRKDMAVTAFMGDGRAIQLTLGADHDGKGCHEFITLNEKQVNDLITVLQARLENKITSTGNEKLGLFYPDRTEEDDGSL